MLRGGSDLAKRDLPPELSAALRLAWALAARLGHACVGTEHLLLALAMQPQGADGRLLHCKQRCVVVPALLAWLSGEGCDSHYRCVLCKTSDPLRPVTMENIAGVVDTAKYPLVSGYWRLGAPGTYRVYAKWQAGHYDYRKIKNVKFRIYGVSTGWRMLPLTHWLQIATVTVDERYHITVNGQVAKRAGNQSTLEKK